MTIYHGTTISIEHPLVGVGRPELDFGPGFYVTKHLQQAKEWAGRMARQRKETAIVNQYSFDETLAKSTYNCLIFGKYDVAWLDFTVASRLGLEPWRGYDFIEGGVANDRVIDTVEGYIAGTINSAQALAELSKHQPNNQICLLNQNLADRCLTFEKALVC